VENCELGILLLLQHALKFSGLKQSADLFLGDDLKIATEPFRCCGMPAQMLRQASVEVDC
jgi:hypothetical protein